MLDETVPETSPCTQIASLGSLALLPKVWSLSAFCNSPIHEAMAKNFSSWGCALAKRL